MLVTLAKRLAKQSGVRSLMTNNSQLINANLSGTNLSKQQWHHQQQHLSISSRRCMSSTDVDWRSAETNDLLVEKKDQVLWITFNRPAKYNAITIQMYNKLIKTFNDANNDDSIKALLLTGVGDYYCSGNDLLNFKYAGKHPKGLEAGLELSKDILVEFVDSLINLNKFAIAAINGPTIGIATTTLPLFDYVVASDTSTFTSPFTNLGLCPEGCSSITFPKIMGHTRATEMLLMNKKISATQAKEYGLVSEIVEKTKFSKHLNQLLHNPKTGLVSTCYSNSLKVGKALIRSQAFKSQLTEANRREAKVLLDCWLGEESREAIQKFVLATSKKQ